MLVPLVGAILPAVAILEILRSKELANQALKTFVLAQAMVALFGSYQFVAENLGFPIFLRSPADIDGIRRVSALSHEPAFYAAYVVTGLPLLIGDVINRTRRLAVSPKLILGLVLVPFLLTFSRAGILALLFICVGIAVIFLHKKTGTLLRMILAALVVSLAAVAVLSSLMDRNLGEVLRARTASTLDPNEPASNAVRLLLYQRVVKVIRANPFLGVGPGNLGYALPEFGATFPSGQESTATANSIWLQAAVDAGLLAIPLVLGVIVSAFSIWRQTNETGKFLVLGAGTFLVVNGALVSFFWDLKFWSVLGLALAIKNAQRCSD